MPHALDNSRISTTKEREDRLKLSKLIEQLSEVDPQHSNAFYHLGNMLYDQGRVR